MRKLYFFLIAALLMPVLAMAQGNKGLSFTQPNPYNNYTNTVEIPYVGLIEDKIPATKDVAYSVGFWIKPAAIGYSSQFTAANGSGMGLLFGFGTNEHTNLGQWQYGLGYTTDGAIQIIGQGAMGAQTNGFAPDPAEMIDTLSLEEWNYVVFTIDNANLKACLYVDGEKKHEAALAKPGMYWSSADGRNGGDNGKWPTFQFFSFIANGSLDEVQFWSRAITDEEVKSAMTSAYTVSNLIGLYEFNEVKEGTTGTFENKAPGGVQHDVQYKKINYGAYWAGSANVNRSGSAEQAPVFVDGRTIEIKDVTVTLPATDGGAVTLTAEDGTELTTGSHTLKTQDIYTVNAVPAEGYALKGLYNKIGEGVSSIKNGSKYVVVADAEVYGDFTNDLSTLNIVVGDGAEYTLTRNGEEITDLSKIINGDEYVLAVNITDPAKKLVDVKLNDEVLEAANGVYTFTAAAGQTITISTVDKPYYVVTIEQPAEGGTITVLHGDEVVESGTEIRESEVLEFVANTEENWTCLGWYVNGEMIKGNTYTVTEAFTLSTVLKEGIPSCVPQPVEGRSAGTQTSRQDRLVRSVTVSAGDASIVLDGNTDVPREIYMDQSGKMIEVEAGQKLTLAAKGIGVWMRTYIWADFDYNGLDVNDLAYGVYDNSDINIERTRQIDIPAWAKEGYLYRVRYMVDWNGDSPCVYGQASGDNGEYITDFSLMVKQPRIDATRTIAIKSNDTEFGQVAFVNIDAEGNSVTTDYAKVIVKAEVLKEGATFINWTDAQGNVVSTNPEYTYTAAEDVELTANFGFAVTYTANEGGAVAVLVDGKAIASGDGVIAGSELTIEATPNSGYEVESITVNGSKATTNPVTVQVNGALEIEVVFAEAAYKLTYSVSTGNGHIEVTDEISDEETPAGNAIANNSNLTLGSDIIVFWIAGEGDALTVATLTNGSTFDMFVGEEDDYFVPMPTQDGSWYSYLTVEGAVEAVGYFSGESAIEGIEADDANAPVEFYNLQGVRVNGENLTPGIYVRRQGSKAVKVYVTKK